jgi:hypothetical protein
VCVNPRREGVNRVNRIFDRVRLAAPRPAAPRIAFCDQEGPAIAPRYLTAAVASGAAVLSVDHEQKSFLQFCGNACVAQLIRLLTIELAWL